MTGLQFELKNDKYRKARGGSTRLLDIFCVSCNGLLMKYQKDGKGNLLRCYLNRIFYPPNLEQLQHDPKIQSPRDMLNLACSQCKSVIGTPMFYEDGRLAFRLRKGLYYKKLAE
jgi:hypothetical protein